MLAVQDSVTECLTAGITPVPDIGIDDGAPVASLAIIKLPLAGPAAVGLNNTVTAMLWVGDSVTGAPAPVIPNAAPLTLTCEIATLELPVFVSVTICDAELPVFTEPKMTADGLADKVDVALTPVPLRAIGVGEPGALLSKVRLPAALVAACGANCTLNVPVCCGAKLRGTLRPAVVKPVPVRLAAEIVKLALPVLLICTV